MDGFTFHERAFAFGDPYIHDVPGSDVGHKYDLSIVMTNAFSFGSDPLNAEIGDDFVFHFSRHGRKIREKWEDRILGLKFNHFLDG